MVCVVVSQVSSTPAIVLAAPPPRTQTTSRSSSNCSYVRLAASKKAFTGARSVTGVGVFQATDSATALGVVISVRSFRPMPKRSEAMAAACVGGVAPCMGRSACRSCHSATFDCASTVRN